MNVTTHVNLAKLRPQSFVLADMTIAISRLAFEHHRTALGISETEPRISWRFGGNAVNWEQTAYDIELERFGRGSESLGDSYEFYSVNSSESLVVPWPSDPLESAGRANVRVRAHGRPGQSSTPWSDWVSVETGLLTEEHWAGAVPVAADRDTEANGAHQPIYFRKSFNIEADEIAQARLYITSLGVYEAEINGQRGLATASSPPVGSLTTTVTSTIPTMLRAFLIAKGRTLSVSLSAKDGGPAG